MEMARRIYVNPIRPNVRYFVSVPFEPASTIPQRAVIELNALRSNEHHFADNRYELIDAVTFTR